jgi:hypothetical protein
MRINVEFHELAWGRYACEIDTFNIVFGANLLWTSRAKYYCLCRLTWKIHQEEKFQHSFWLFYAGNRVPNFTENCRAAIFSSVNGVKRVISGFLRFFDA